MTFVSQTGIKIHAYGKGIKGPVGRESEQVMICHQCLTSSTQIVRGIISGLPGLTNPLVFGYKKECSVGKFLVDISTGMYVPQRPEFYAVKSGITQLAFGYKNPQMKTRPDEEKTKFYLTSFSTFLMSQPHVYSAYLFFQ